MKTLWIDYDIESGWTVYPEDPSYPFTIKIEITEEEYLDYLRVQKEYKAWETKLSKLEVKAKGY